jgi:hypothetical protein
MLDNKSMPKYLPYVAVMPTKGRRIDYYEIASIISSFKMPVFLPINRKTAHYARKKLYEILCEEVIAVPAKWKELNGYLFLLKSWFNQETQTRTDH